MMPMLDEPTIITCLILLKQHVERMQGREKTSESGLRISEALEDGVARAKQKVMRAAKAAHTAELALANMEAYAKAAGVFAEEK